MDDRKMLTTGLIGSAVAALCCFTPLAVWVLGGVGLASLAYLIDPVAMAVLAASLTLAGYALWKRRQLK